MVPDGKIKKRMREKKNLKVKKKFLPNWNKAERENIEMTPANFCLESMPLPGPSSESSQ